MHLQFQYTQDWEQYRDDQQMAFAKEDIVIWEAFHLFTRARVRASFQNIVNFSTESDYSLCEPKFV